MYLAYTAGDTWTISGVLGSLIITLLRVYYAECASEAVLKTRKTLRERNVHQAAIFFLIFGFYM